MGFRPRKEEDVFRLLVKWCSIFTKSEVTPLWEYLTFESFIVRGHIKYNKKLLDIRRDFGTSSTQKIKVNLF